MPTWSTLANSGDLASTDTYSFAVDAGSGDDRVLVVVVRHADSSAGLTHATPTYNGVAMTQCGTIEDATSINTIRRFTVWKLADPASGSNTLTGTISASATSLFVSAFLASDAEDVDLTSVAQIGEQSSADASLDITPNAADSSLFVTVMSSSTSAEPWAPQGAVTELEDSDSASAHANMAFASGDEDATGTSAQSVGFTPAASVSWGAIAIEVQAPASGGVERIVGRSLTYDFLQKKLLIESGV